MWRLNYMILNNQWGKEESNREIKKYLETNEKGSTIYQNLWEVAKAVRRDKFIEINTYIKKQERPQQPHFIPEGTRKEQINPQVSS